MSIDYTTLTTRLGKNIKLANALLSLQGTTLIGDANAVLDQYETQRDLVPTLYSQFSAYSKVAQTWLASGVLPVVLATLGDLQTALNAPTAKPSDVLPLLSIDMIANSQTVKANTVTSPAITPGGSNVGTGLLVASKENKAGADDERARNETVRFACVVPGTNGTASFSVVGAPVYPAVDYRTSGSGAASSQIQVTGRASTALANGDFDGSFATNVPANWTLSAGTGGTNCFSEASIINGAGGKSVKLLAAAATTITLYQQITLTDKIYCAGGMIRIGGTFGTGSTLQIAIKADSGFTTVNLFNGDPHGLTTSFALSSVFFAGPTGPVSNLRLEVTWTSASTAGSTAAVYFDDFGIPAAFDLGHTQYAIFRGPVDFALGDTFSVVTANNNAGVFQTFFSRFYDIMLPSATGSGETIADTLAT